MYSCNLHYLQIVCEYSVTLSEVMEALYIRCLAGLQDHLATSNVDMVKGILYIVLCMLENGITQMAWTHSHV